MTETDLLFDLIQRLEDLDAVDRSSPLVLYAQNGANAGRDSRAMACPRGESGGPECPLDPSLSEVLSVQQAREAIEVWSNWRGGLAPSPYERFSAVMFYARYAVFLPAEPDRDGM
jgi:hypothetical protein